jgi:hypothetical protein
MQVIDTNYNLIKNFLLTMLYFKKIESVASAVHYKNRFLINKRSCKNQLLGLLENDGKKINKLKLVNKIYLDFLREFHLLKTANNLYSYYKSIKIDFGEFINLYNLFYLFKN